jgi:hypothetical protein
MDQDTADVPEDDGTDGRYEITYRGLMLPRIAPQGQGNPGAGKS